MKIIYSSLETERQGILVLSLEGLKYKVSFTEMVADQTHIPMFEDKEYYYLADGKFQGFRPTKCLYGFRYEQPDGELSKPYTAVFCTIDGEEAVILAEYAQSHADDEFDNMSRTRTATGCGSSGHASLASTERSIIAVTPLTRKVFAGHTPLRS